MQNETSYIKERNTNTAKNMAAKCEVNCCEPQNKSECSDEIIYSGGLRVKCREDNEETRAVRKACYAYQWGKAIDSAEKKTKKG